MPLASLIPNWCFLIKNASALFLPENPSSLHKGLWKSHHCEKSQSRAGQPGERNIIRREKKLLQLGHHHLKNISVMPLERAARLQCLKAKLLLQTSVFCLCFCLCLTLWLWASCLISLQLGKWRQNWGPCSSTQQGDMRISSFVKYFEIKVLWRWNVLCQCLSTVSH